MKFRQLIKLFARFRCSINRFFDTLGSEYGQSILTLIRKRIAEHRETQYPFKGEIEVEESYFGRKRVKGKRGRGAYKKTPVFGILKRGGKVYAEFAPDCAKAML